MNESILKLLCCPKDNSSLELKDGEFYTQKTSYPLFNNIPWLFNEPEESFLEWGSKAQAFFKSEESELNAIHTSNELEDDPDTKERINRIIEARKNNVHDMFNRLSMFNGITPIPVSPDTQQIHSYFNLIFRDWTKGNSEISEYTKYIQSLLTDKTKNVLILGSGAGGLSYNIAKANNDTNFVSLEHNPYLALVSDAIINGEKVELTEYSYYPKDLAHTSHDHTLEATESITNHQVILGSFPQLPFKKEAFDLIIAPWFLDILHEHLDTSLTHLTKFLSSDGKLAFIGPANFHKKEIFNQYCKEEIVNKFEKYFSSVESDTKSVNYLESDLNSQQRREEVLFISAVSKIKNITAIVPTKSQMIKFTPTLESYKQKIDTFQKILKHINSEMSLLELAEKLEVEFSFEKKESLHYAGIFYKMILKNLD